MPRIQLGAVGLEAQTLPVRYAAPSIIFLFSFDLNKASKFENKFLSSTTAALNYSLVASMFDQKFPPDAKKLNIHSDFFVPVFDFDRNRIFPVSR